MPLLRPYVALLSGVQTTATRIRACVALTGCTPDSAAPVAVLVQQQHAGLPLPPQLIMDQATGWGKVRADVDIQSASQTTMVARVPPSGGSDPNRCTVADFGVNVERTTCTCPNGVVSTKAYAHGDSDGLSFRFLASQCRACPLWAMCRDPDANPKGHRSVCISDYHVYLRAADTFNHTSAGRALLASRWRVEPTVAWLVRYQGCRQARRVGHVAAGPAISGVCAAQPLAVAQSRAAWAGAAPSAAMSRRIRPFWSHSRPHGPAAAWARGGGIRRVPAALRRGGATTTRDPRRCPSGRRGGSSSHVRQRPRDTRNVTPRPQLPEALLRLGAEFLWEYGSLASVGGQP